MKPTSKKLILGLLLAAEGRALTVREAINACGLFDITENNVRVTLVRLSAEGLIKASGRGAYVIGPNAQETATQVATWHRAEDQLKEWHGAYIAAHIGNLGRSDRKALKQRERAMDMLGMKELDRGLYVRPDNLAGGVNAVRERLLALGLEPEAVTFVATEFDSSRQANIPQLWDTEALNNLYRTQKIRLDEWLDSYVDFEPEVAARESYLLGGQAIRQVVFDPWLPPPFVDTEARHVFVETVKRFDETGKAIWDQLYKLYDDMPARAASTHLTSGVLQ